MCFRFQIVTGTHHFAQVVEGQAAVHRCEGAVEMEVDGYPMYPAVVNQDAGRRRCAC
jgi:hypothetical protein